jgi:hypothetical protein
MLLQVILYNSSSQIGDLKSTLGPLRVKLMNQLQPMVFPMQRVKSLFGKNDLHAMGLQCVSE